MLAGILRHFLTLDTSPVTAASQPEPLAFLNSDSDREGQGGGGDSEAKKVVNLSPLEVRMAQLEHYIEQLPRNVEDRRKLVGHGYSDTLWDQVSFEYGLAGQVFGLSV